MVFGQSVTIKILRNFFNKTSSSTYTNQKQNP